MALSGRRVAGAVRLLLAAAIGLVVLVLALLLAARPQLSFRADLSPQARFTFGKDTQELLGELREKKKVLEIHTFYEPLVGNPTNADQRHLVQMHRTLQSMTRDLVRLYERAGGEAVRVTDHDLLREVTKTSATRKTLGVDKRNAIALVLDRRVKALSLDIDLAEIDPGMPQEGVPGAKPTLPVLKQYKGEEAVSSAIRSLLVEGNPAVYFVSSYGGPSLTAGIADSYSELAGALSTEGFKVNVLDLERTREIPADAAVVAIVEPRREMSEAVAAVLEAWLRRGGRLFLNVGWMPEPEEWNPRFDELGARLGFTIGADLVCHLVRDPQNPRQSLGGTHAMTLHAELNPVHKITRPLQGEATVVLKTARELGRRAATEPAGVRVDLSLLRTGPLAWIERRTQQSSPGATPLPDFVPPSDRAAFDSHPLGAVIDVDGTDPKRPGHVVLVSGVGFGNLGFGVNQSFVMNAFNWLAERRELVGVRGRNIASRRLQIVPQQLDRVFWLLVLGVPVALLLLGGVVLWRRSR